MGPEFVRRHAPKLYSEAADGFMGGTTVAEQGDYYDRVTGMPSPYLDVEGEERRYFGDPVLRGRLEDEPYPTAGLETPRPPSGGASIPGEPSAWHDRPPPQPGSRWSMDNLPSAPSARVTLPQPENMLEPRRTDGVFEGAEQERRLIAGLRSGVMNPLERTGNPESDRVARQFLGDSLANPSEPSIRERNEMDSQGVQSILRNLQGMSVQEALERVGIRFPTFLPRDNGSVSSEDLRGRNAEVQGFSRRSPVNTDWSGRAPEIEEYLSTRGIRFTEGASRRTNNAVAGGHGEGNSLDVRPQDINMVMSLLASNPDYQDIPVEILFIRRGQQFGNGVVATGDHYHLDFGPAASPGSPTALNARRSYQGILGRSR